MPQVVRLVLGILNYPRHFCLLALAVAALTAARPALPAMGIVSSFGLYGVLHAAAFAASVRPATSWQRKLLFIAVAAVLSMASAAVCLQVGRALLQLPGGRVPLLALAAGLGAGSYALLIEAWCRPRLGAGRWAATCLAAMAATLAVLPSGLLVASGGAWTAAAWWCGFSGMLCACDAGRSSDRKKAKSPAQ